MIQSQQLLNKLLILHIPILRLRLFNKLLHLLLGHRYPIRPQIIPELTHRQEPIPLCIKHSKTLHQLFLHAHLVLFLYLKKMFIEINTINPRKSAKSIFDDTNGLSDLITLSPNISITKVIYRNTLLLCDSNPEYFHNAGYIFCLDIAILLLVIHVKDISILFDKLWVDLWFHLWFVWCCLL